MKNTPCKISFSNNRKKRNMWVFDAGLHTLGMEKGENELDVNFVNRFLIKYFEGCRNRGTNKYRDYFIQHNPTKDYVIVWGIK